MEGNQMPSPNPLQGDPAPNVVSDQKPQESPKLPLYLIAGLVIVILVTLGIYWYLGSQKRQQLTPTPLPRVEDDVNSLESETRSLIIEDIEADFQNVDQDLKNL